MNAGPSSPNRFRNYLKALFVLTCFTILVVGMTAQPAGASGREDEGGSPMPAVQTPADRYTSYTSTPTAAGGYRVKANFRSFSGDPLSIGFMLDPAASRQSLQEFGVSSVELDALMAACMATKGCGQDEFNRHATRYYGEHALRLKPSPGKAARLFVDVPKVVQRNRGRVQPVATALRRLAAERGHDTQWMVDAAVALVQTGLRYQQPAAWDEGRRILGFYPPPRALERGYGDCDTKSALLAAILLNLTESRVIGVHVPQHYLLGIAATPREGQAYITHGGQRYVLVEAAGPAQRRRGEIAHATQAALQRMDGVRIDQIF